MRESPDIAALLGDPGRANMLVHLMGGRALTATELAGVAGITAPTASSHLGKLVAAGLVAIETQGRHRYYRLRGPDIADLLKVLMGVAERAGHRPLRTGPRDPGLRRARICYDHLAGDYGVRLFDFLAAGELLLVTEETVALSDAGRGYMAGFGIDLAALETARRPLCRPCLDWSARRRHLAGSLGAALLQRFGDLGWVTRQPDSRVMTFTPVGVQGFSARFGSIEAG